jgi:hypothetical protein
MRGVQSAGRKHRQKPVEKAPRLKILRFFVANGKKEV